MKASKAGIISMRQFAGSSYKPNPNPYLELKAIALNLLGRKVEALSLLNEAKLVFHEAWKAENQALLEHLQKSQANQL